MFKPQISSVERICNLILLSDTTKLIPPVVLTDLNVDDQAPLL